MSSCYAILAEQILINLQYMERKSQSSLNYTGFALLALLLKLPFKLQ